MKNFGVLPCALLLALLIFDASLAFAAPPQHLLTKLKKTTTDQLEVSFHQRTGYLRFLWAKRKHPLAGPRKTLFTGKPEEAARALFTEYASLFGIKNQEKELSLKRQKTTRDGRYILKFQQKHQGVPVFAGEIMSRQDKYMNVSSLNGETASNIHIDINPAITKGLARKKALALIAQQYQLDASQLQTTAPELWIYNPTLLGLEPNKNQLAWRLVVTVSETLAPCAVVLVDAHSGQILLQYSQRPSALYRSVYDNQGASSSLPGTSPVRVEGDPPVVEEDVNYAYDYTADTYNFYLNYHGRDSLDGSGMNLVSTVHYPVNNAFWHSSKKQMVYGTGFPQADDIVGHELTHAVTEYESNLLYYMQSGAISESLSDVWGEFIDLTNFGGNDTETVRWLIGENLPSGPMRNMSNPLDYGDPDKMSSSHYYCGSSDSGGVHINSGVNNKAAFLMTDGGTFNGQTVSGIGLSKTAKIYYEAQNTILTSGSDYADLYDALLLACSTLTGTEGVTEADCLEVQKALISVEMNMSPQACTIADPPICEAGFENNLFFDDLENGGSNWSHLAILGSDNWDLQASGWAKSGVYSLFTESSTTTSDSFVKMTKSIAVPPEAYFHFYHAFTFQEGSDGGVVEYSLDGGASWHDAGPLVTHNGYNTTLSSSSGNPIGGRNAYTGESNGYFSTRIDLNPLAGQHVLFRFRIGTDNAFGFWPGWVIDDIRIYTCNSNESIQFSSYGATVSESAGIINIPVSRTGPGTGEVTVNCSTSDGTAFVGSDYSASTEVLQWLDGDTTDKTCSVLITDDNNVEGTETINLGLSSATGAATIGNPSTSTITIEDNDFYGSLQFSKSFYSVDESGGSIGVAVSRTNGTSGAVSAQCTVDNGTAKNGIDYNAVSEQLLTWADGDSTDKFCTLTILDDSQTEGNESVQLNLINPSGGATAGMIPSAQIAILDNAELTGLNTLFAGGYAFNGAMFDITALESVSIEGFSVNSKKEVGELFDAEVYYKAGGYAGFAENAGAWTLAGKASGIVSSGPGSATLIPVPVHVTITEGQTHCFYITTTDGSELRFTLGTSEGTVTAQDNSIQVLEGVMNKYSFGTHHSPFIWNGTIHYYKATDLINCSGESVIIENTAFEAGKTYECRATTSISVEGGVTMEPGSDVTFIAPSIKLNPFFTGLPNFHIRTP